MSLEIVHESGGRHQILSWGSTTEYLDPNKFGWGLNWPLKNLHNYGTHILITIQVHVERIIFSIVRLTWKVEVGVLKSFIFWIDGRKHDFPNFILIYFLFAFGSCLTKVT